MEDKSLTDVAPGRARSSEHDEDKQHDRDTEGRAGVDRVDDKRHHYTRHKSNLGGGKCLFGAFCTYLV